MKNLMFCALALVVGTFAYPGFSEAQTYPTRPVRVIIPFPPGEAADIIARLIQPVISERMGQQFVVENRPGASGQIGLTLLKSATPDGYTIGIGQGGNLVVAPHTYKKLAYDPVKDFAAIAVTNDVRVPNKPNLPIFADVVPGYDMRGWFGFIAPAGTPPDIVKRLNAEINRAMQQPDVKAKLTTAGLLVANESADYFQKFIRSEYDKYGKLVRSIGLLHKL